MPKATIQFVDVEDQPGQVRIDLTFDPAPVEGEPITAAQAFSLQVNDFIRAHMHEAIREVDHVPGNNQIN